MQFLGTQSSWECTIHVPQNQTLALSCSLELRASWGGMGQLLSRGSCPSRGSPPLSTPRHCTQVLSPSPPCLPVWLLLSQFPASRPRPPSFPRLTAVVSATLSLSQGDPCPIGVPGLPATRGKTQLLNMALGSLRVLTPVTPILAGAALASWTRPALRGVSSAPPACPRSRLPSLPSGRPREQAGPRLRSSAGHPAFGHRLLVCCLQPLMPLLVGSGCCPPCLPLRSCGGHAVNMGARIIGGFSTLWPKSARCKPILHTGWPGFLALIFFFPVVG